MLFLMARVEHKEKIKSVLCRPPGIQTVGNQRDTKRKKGGRNSNERIGVCKVQFCGMGLCSPRVEREREVSSAKTTRQVEGCRGSAEPPVES